MACEYPGGCQGEFSEACYHQDGDQNFCILHLRNDHPEKEAQKETFRRALDAATHNWTNLAGVCFLGKGATYSIVVKDEKKAANWFENCVFGEDLTLAIEQGNICLDPVTFEGFATIIVARGKIYATKKTFPFKLRLITKIQHRGTLLFEKCRFKGPVSIETSAGEPAGRVEFTRCKFWEQLIVHAPLPQSTSFHKIKVKRKGIAAEYEGGYRSIRVGLEKHKNREDEGAFFTLEKRCLRKRLGWFSLSRFVSWGYDFVSNYGRSFERATCVFMFFQVAFLLAYSLGLNRWHWPGVPDVELISFTTSQVVSPFELFSLRTPPSDLLEGKGEKWKYIAATQSVISLACIALFLLALRWRFRRE